jgi:hypothetical protein
MNSQLELKPLAQLFALRGERARGAVASKPKPKPKPGRKLALT